MKTASSDDVQLIRAIVKRAARLRVHSPQHRILLDLAACHANGCPLDLYGLLGSSEADFRHDVEGISRHINRETGQLDPREVFDCMSGKQSKVTFRPRCSQKVEEYGRHPNVD
jgi:hypothetical protein